MFSQHIHKKNLLFMLSAVVVYLFATALASGEYLAACKFEVGECKESHDVIKSYNERFRENLVSWDDKKCADYNCLLPAMKVNLGQRYAYCVETDEFIERRDKNGTISKVKLRRQESRKRNRRVLSVRRDQFCVNKPYVAAIEEALREVAECTGINYFSMLPLLIHESRLGLNMQSDTGASCLGQLTGDSIRETHKYFKEKNAFSKQFKSKQCKSTREKIQKADGYEDFPDRVPTFVGKKSRDDIEDMRYKRRRCQFLENPHLCLLYTSLQFKKSLTTANRFLKKCEEKFKEPSEKKTESGKIAREILDWLKPTDQKLTYFMDLKEKNIKSIPVKVTLKFSILLATWAHNAGPSIFAYVSGYCDKLKKNVISLDDFIKKLKSLVDASIDERNKKDLRNIAKIIGLEEKMREYSAIIAGVENYKSLEEFKKFIRESNTSLDVENITKGLITKSRKNEILEYPDDIIKDSYHYIIPSCQEKTGWLKVENNSRKRNNSSKKTKAQLGN